MRKSADVRSIDALQEAKAALAEFREVATVALSEASSEVQRTLGWLQSDRRTYWEHTVRKRREKVAQAKSDLYRAKLAAMDDRASCVEQRKGLEHAERALEEAQRKVEAVRKWGRALEREMMLFRGALQPLARTVEVDIPRGEAKLDLLRDKLDKYLRLATPDAGRGPARKAESNTSGSGPPGSTPPGPTPTEDPKS